jgi:hypothetical protein
MSPRKLKVVNVAQLLRREAHIITNVRWVEPLHDIAPKDLNMTEQLEKNMARRSRRSKKGTFAQRHHISSEGGTQEATKAGGLIENRANGGYSEAGIGIVPISILT